MTTLSVGGGFHTRVIHIMSRWHLQCCVCTPVMNSDAKASQEVLVMVVYFGNEGWGFYRDEISRGKNADFFCACTRRHHICHIDNVRVQMVSSSSFLGGIKQVISFKNGKSCGCHQTTCSAGTLLKDC